MGFGALVETVIGLVLVYVTISLLCTTLQEELNTWLNRRGWLLERILTELLSGSSDELADLSGASDQAKRVLRWWKSVLLTSSPPRDDEVAEGDPSVLSVYAKRLRHWFAELFRTRRAARDEDAPESLADGVLDHGLVRGLMQGERLPSYVPARIFSQALLDVLRRRAGEPEVSVSAARAAIEDLPEGRTREALATIVSQAGDDLATLRSGLASWYDAAMARTGGAFKRSTRAGLLVVGLVVSVTVNVDTIHIVKELHSNTALRAAVVDAAKKLEEAGVENADATRLRAQLDDLGMPIGWSPAPQLRSRDLDSGLMAMMVVGWLLTAVAISFGAPFWFQLLTAFLSLRGTGKSPVEGAAASAAPAADSAGGAAAAAPRRTSALPAGSVPASAQTAYERTRLRPDDIKDVQRALGLAATEVNGVLNSRTRELIRARQRKLGRTPTGQLTPYLVHRLLNP